MSFCSGVPPFRRGDGFGERALLYGEARALSAYAKTHAFLIVIRQVLYGEAEGEMWLQFRMVNFRVVQFSGVHRLKFKLGALRRRANRHAA